MMRLLLLVLLGVLISACEKEKYTYSYLLTHFEVLATEYNHCQTMKQMTEAEIQYCQMVTNAGNAYSAVQVLERRDPEKVGMQVLEAQMALAKDEVDIANAERKLAESQGKDAAIAKTNLNAILTTYKNKQQEVEMTLNVIGLSAPE